MYTNSTKSLGGVSVNYQWKLLNWIISKMITFIEKSIRNMHFIHTLVKTKIRIHTTNTLT